MNTNTNTIRLLFPQWQGGNNPNYYFGSELLAQIVPQNDSDEVYRIGVKNNFDKELKIENGVEGERELLDQLIETKEVLKKTQPEKIIVLGGDCAVSQAPFDYLKGKYKEKLGILWLDAHPDVSRIDDATRDHEMVLGNLLGLGAPQFSEKVENKFMRNEVMLAGLIYDELRPKDQDVNTLSLAYATPEDLEKSTDKVLEWIKENKFSYLTVHFDLDVLSPEDFRSIYPAEPYLKSFDAAIGKLKLQQVNRIFSDVSKEAEIVGLSITEHLPWDAFNLRNTLSNIPIFQH